MPRCPPRPSRGPTTTTPRSSPSSCATGLAYNDGSPLNAERFAYSIRRNIDPTTAGEYAAITDEILGAPEWRGCGDDAAACEAAAAQVAESVKATHEDGTACTGYDDAACNSLVLTFSRPAPYFHTVMSLWVTFPAKEELITAAGENWWVDAENHVGNGPYIMDILEQGVRAPLRAQPQLLGRTGQGGCGNGVYYRHDGTLRGL